MWCWRDWEWRRWRERWVDLEGREEGEVGEEGVRRREVGGEEGEEVEGEGVGRREAEEMGEGVVVARW